MEETSFPQHVNDWHNNGNTRRALSARARIFAGRQVPPVSRDSSELRRWWRRRGYSVAFRRSHAMDDPRFLRPAGRPAEASSHRRETEGDTNLDAVIKPIQAEVISMRSHCVQRSRGRARSRPIARSRIAF